MPYCETLAFGAYLGKLLEEESLKPNAPKHLADMLENWHYYLGYTERDELKKLVLKRLTDFITEGNFYVTKEAI